MKNRLILLFASVPFLFAACSGRLALPQAEGEVIAEATHAGLTPTPTELLPSLTPTPSWEALLSEAEELARQGQWEAALAQLEQVQALSPDNEGALVLRGRVHLAQQNYESAAEALIAALAVNPQSANAHFALGLVYNARGDYPAALESFQAAVDSEPNYAPAYRNRAQLYETLGNYESAVIDYQIYLNLVPNSPERPQIEERILTLQGEATDQGQESQLLFLDDFSTTAGDWFTNGDPDLNMNYEEGSLRLALADANSAAWSLTNRIFTDTSIQAVAQRVGGSDDNYFGLMCRIQGTTAGADFYMFMVSSDGFYGIAKRINGGELTLLNADQLQYSPQIPQGDQPLDLLIECDEDRLALFVDEQLITEVYDEDLGAGQVGVFVGTFAEGGTDVRFDDFQVISLSASP